MRLRLLLLPAALLLGASLPAQMFEDKVSWSAAVTPATAGPGEQVTLRVTVLIEPGFHIYGSLEPTGPTTLMVDGAGPLAAQGAPRIPPGEEHDAFGIKSFWLAGVPVLEQTFRVPPGTEPGAVQVTGRVGYTVCNDMMCDPPTEWGFTATLEIGAAPAEELEPQTDIAPLPFTIPGFEGLNQEPKVFLDARVVPATARPGERVTLEITAKINPGWHIYGSKEEVGDPTRLAVDPLEGLVAAGNAVIPPGKPYEAMNMVNYWVSGEAVLWQAFDIPADAEPGALELTGLVHYMACTETFCDPPAEESFFADLTVEAGAVREEFSPASAPQLGGPVDPLRSSLWLLIVTSIGGGLLALMMPCTYPMIPITFSFFTKQADVRGGNVLPLALAYGAGIILIFVLIGLLVGPVIIAFATHWVTNMVLAVAFAFFALVLFGLVNLQPPQFLNNLGGKAASQGGYIGVFLMGLTLVFATFTCTVPVLGGLLGFTGSGQDLGRLIVGMAVFGATMALPFVALSMVPGKIKAMPRSGEWMHVLKVSLGFVELAAALKFISQADVVEQWGILSRELFLVLWAAIFFVLGIFLLGIFRMAGESQTGIGPGRMVGALMSVAFAFYCAFGALGYRLDNVMTAIVPPYRAELISGGLPGAGGGGDQKAVAAHTIVPDDHEGALEQAIAEDKLVLINFTGFS